MVIQASGDRDDDEMMRFSFGVTGMERIRKEILSRIDGCR